MQTFLPYPDFRESMRVLDPKRLGNQVYREGMTMLRGGWSNHPASKMWNGYEAALCLYLLDGVHELRERGHDYVSRYWHCELQQRLRQQAWGIAPIWEVDEVYGAFTRDKWAKRVVLPPWLGDERIHSSHRACLLYKDPEWYGKYGWCEEPTGPLPSGKLPYVWPRTDV